MYTSKFILIIQCKKPIIQFKYLLTFVNFENTQ
jgi:hypothetical protein